MTYFEDLSSYEYAANLVRADTRNVGWLDHEHAFPRKPPSETLLDRLWAYCRVSVAQTRGVHACAMCPPSDLSYRAERHGVSVLLGTSEIRVFGNDGIVYAAPTLVYHYVSRHHYSPPEEFAAALAVGPSPPDPRYFERLAALALEWRETSLFVGAPS